MRGSDRPGRAAQSTGAPSAGEWMWPAEWSAHRATWMTWPHNPSTWPGKFPRIPSSYAALVRCITDWEPVELLFQSEAAWDAAKPRLDGAIHRVTPHFIRTNDSWIRDYGPTFLTAPQATTRAAKGQSAGQSRGASPEQAAMLAGVDWGFNAWGEKYSPYEDDARVAARILAQQAAPRIPAGLTLEGGAIEGNGAGWMMTTRSCVLSESRNPQWDAAAAEQVFREQLGVHEVIWLSGEGLAGDDTDGHIDQLARFVTADTVVVATARDARDSNSQPLRANVDNLRHWRSASGQALNVIELPTPSRRWCQGHRLPCSYCNFIFVNDAVIVPTFADPSDARALAILGEHLPHRAIIALDALDIVWGLGAFHCLTQQQPITPVAQAASPS